MPVHLPKLLSATLAAACALAIGGGAIAQAASPQSHQARRHHPHKVKHHTAIPQHNGGDHDADNNGGPSDGDGNI